MAEMKLQRENAKTQEYLDVPLLIFVVSRFLSLFGTLEPMWIDPLQML